MKLGQIVFIFCDSALESGRVVGTFAGKVEVENPSGVRTVYAERRVAHTSDCVVATADALEQHLKSVEAQRAQVDLEELWTLLLEDSNRSYDLAALSDWVFPSSSTTACDALYCALAQDCLYFKRGKDQKYTPNSAVSVEERKRKLAVELAAAAEMAAMVTWLRSPEMPPNEAGRDAIELLQQLVLFEQDATHFNRTKQLVRTVWPNNPVADTQLALDTLLQLNVWSPDENLAVLRSGIRTEFSADVLADADQLCAVEWGIEGRADYRDWTTLAVDDERTTEVDDALAIRVEENGERTVLVCIADASHWIPEGCKVDDAALDRTTTVYLPEAKLPMLPSCLGQERASLIVGEDCLVLAFVFTLDASGELLSFRIEEAVIRLSARLTYQAVEDIMVGEEHEYGEDVRELSRLADVFRARRQDSGALILDRYETTVTVADGPTVEVNQYWTGGVSHRLVSEWMIMTCSNVAQWFRERNIPALYRAQDVPDGKVRIPSDRPILPYELNQALRLIRGAYMTSEPAPHSGLGLPCYTQVTSPLRRYPDLLMHRQIRHVLRRGQPLFNSSDLSAMLETLDRGLRTAARVERETRRYWLLKSLESRRGEPLPLEVLRSVGRRFLVHILENGLRTLWSPSIDVQPGDRCEPSIEVADARADKLILN